MTRNQAILQVMIAAGKRRLWQHAEVAERIAAGAFMRRPLSTSTSMRSALGLLDDDGHIDKTVIVRMCDPGDADDHRHYWPLTVRRRWRWNGQGLDLDLTDKPTDVEYEIIANAIVEEVDRLTPTQSPQPAAPAPRKE